MTPGRRWQPALGANALSGAYRPVFETALAASGPATVPEPTRTLGRDAVRLNEVEKVRHRRQSSSESSGLVMGAESQR